MITLDSGATAELDGLSPAGKLEKDAFNHFYLENKSCLKAFTINKTMSFFKNSVYSPIKSELKSFFVRFEMLWMTASGQL